MTKANNRTHVTNSKSSNAMIKPDPALGHAEVRIDHRGLIDRTNATIDIGAFVSNDRMVHSVYAITCLKKSSRSSSVGTSGLIVDCSHPRAELKPPHGIPGKTMNSTPALLRHASSPLIRLTCWFRPMSSRYVESTVLHRNWRKP